MQIVKKKSESKFRWLILFLTCIMMIGNYYCYDIPAALNSQMDDYMGKPGNFETLFSLLYTVYSVPNVILPFFGGYFIDHLGVRVCLLIFAILITAGQALFALGLTLKSWPVMFLGRLIFGFGGENIGVANSAILSVWFEGKELAFAFGLNLSIARLGSVINNLVSPALANSAGIQFALWFGVFLCAASIGAVVVISGVDTYVESVIEGKGAHNQLVDQDDEGALQSQQEKDERNSEIRKGLLQKENKAKSVIDGSVVLDDEENEHRSSSASKGGEPEREPVTFSDIFKFKQIFWLLAIICVVVYGCVLPFNNIASALLLERDYFQEPPSDCHLTDQYQCQSDKNVPVHCPSSKWYQPPLPKNFTIDDVDCTDDYWSDDCTKTFCDRQADAQVQAGTTMSIPYIISAVLSPVLGGVVDRYGMRAIIATISPLVLVVVHAFMGFSDVSPVGPLVGQGLAYTGFAAVLWPSVALVVEQRLVGLGYGIVVSVQNGGLAAFPLIIASIYQNSGNEYIPNVEVFFIALAWLGVMIGLYLNFYDYYYLHSIMNFPEKYKRWLMRKSGSFASDADRKNSKQMNNPLHDNDKVIGGVRNSGDGNRSNSGSMIH